MKHRSSRLGAWAHLARLILALSVLMGAFTTSTQPAQAKNIHQLPPEPQGLAIAQGTFLDYRLAASDVLVFNLDVRSPAQGVRYYWSLEGDPSLGQAVVEDTGERVRVRYFPMPYVYGKDGFTVILTSSVGGQARIFVSLTVDPAEDRLDIGIPEPLSQPTLDDFSVFGSAADPAGTRVAGPTLVAIPNLDAFQGSGWAANSTVTLTIKPDLWVKDVVTDGNGDFTMTNFGFDVRAGYVVEGSDGINTVTYTVQFLQITHTEVFQDFVRGTTNPGAVVDVLIDDGIGGYFSKTATSNGAGVWLADFTGITDIVVGDIGVARQSDSAGNRTDFYFLVINPTIEVYPQDNIVSAYNWPLVETLTLSIGPYRWLQVNQFFDTLTFDFFTTPFDIQAGQILEITDGVISRSYRVPELEVTDIDEDRDMLSGTAYYGRQVEVFASSSRTGSAAISVTPDASGFWEVDFSSYVDIQPGVVGFVRLYDDTGNVTRTEWSVPDPYIAAYPDNDYVRGWRWPVHADVTLIVDGVHHGTARTEGYGSVHFSLEDLRPGQSLTMTSGDYVQTTVIPNLAVKVINQTADNISGTAAPNRSLTVGGFGSSSGYTEMDVTADAAGNWAADFSGIMDIGPGASGSVLQYDSVGNYSSVNWRVPLPPNPQILVSLTEGFVEGMGWSPDAEVTVTIGDEQWTLSADQEGRIRLQTAIEPGDVIHMTDGTLTRVYTVANLSVLDIDESLDIMRGTADQNEEIEIMILNTVGRVVHRTITADPDGAWTADFSGYFDLVPGTIYGIIQQDDPVNVTYLIGFVPDPSMAVLLHKNRVTGSMWPPNEEIMLEVGIYQLTTRSSPMGEILFDTGNLRIDPGLMYIVFGGGYSMGYVPWAIEPPKIDYAADVISGVVQRPSGVRLVAPVEIQVQVCVANGCVSQYPGVDGDGYWEADFSDVVDITIGVHGYISSVEPGNTITRQHWAVYGYYHPIMAK